MAENKTIEWIRKNWMLGLVIIFGLFVLALQSGLFAYYTPNRYITATQPITITFTATVPDVQKVCNASGYNIWDYSKTVNLIDILKITETSSGKVIYDNSPTAKWTPIHCGEPASFTHTITIGTEYIGKNVMFYSEIHDGQDIIKIIDKPTFNVVSPTAPEVQCTEGQFKCDASGMTLKCINSQWQWYRDCTKIGSICDPTASDGCKITCSPNQIRCVENQDYPPILREKCAQDGSGWIRPLDAKLTCTSGTMCQNGECVPIPTQETATPQQPVPTQEQIQSQEQIASNLPSNVAEPTGANYTPPISPTCSAVKCPLGCINGTAECKPVDYTTIAIIAIGVIIVIAILGAIGLTAWNPFKRTKRR